MAQQLTAKGWTNPTSVQQSLNPLNTACLCSHLFREVAILGLYLSLSSPHLFLFPFVWHTLHKGKFIATGKKKAPLIGSTIFSLGRQLNFPPSRRKLFFMEDFLRINTLNHHYTDSSCHPTLSLTSSHKEPEQKKKKDAIWQGYNERGLRRDGRHYKKNSGGEILHSYLIGSV